MNPDKRNKTMELRDGRTLGYAEAGDSDGHPIFEFHGNPSSRLGSYLLDDAAKRNQVRIIGIDRPGMGLSDYKPDRKLLDWPEDVIEFADNLGIKEFSILGGSGGVPSTLACAFKTPERIKSVGILFGTRPFDTPGSTKDWKLSRRIQAFMARHSPIWVGSMIMKPVASMMEKDPESAVAKLFKELPKADREVLKSAEIRQKYAISIKEAFHSGTAGVALDFALNVRDWGFRLQDISKRIHLWHGDDDTIVPVAMGKYVAQTIPDCHSTFIPNEGHFSLLPNHANAILKALK